MANKRIVDGPGIWESHKLREVQPSEFRPEFANLIPLATANGVFECCPYQIYSKVYNFNREGWTPEKVSTMLAEFERVKLLFRWLDSSGKWYGFWVGIDKKGRLPSKKRQEEKHEATGPDVPQHLLSNFLSASVIQSGNHATTNREPYREPNGQSWLHGTGIGFGTGMGEGEGGATAPDNQHQPQVPLSPACTENGHIDGQIDQIQGWMLGLTPPLKFAAASKDQATQSTKTILVRRLKEGISVADIKLAIAKIPLDFAPNPGFEIRDNLDAAINQVLKDREEDAAQAKQLRQLEARERAKALAELAEVDRKAELEASLIEDTLGA